MPSPQSPSLSPLSALALALALALTLTLAAGDKVPDIIHVCTQSDPNVSECVKNSIETMRPFLANGIPELKAPPMEPLLLRELTLTDNQQLHIVANDIEAYRTTTFQISDLDVNVKNKVIRFHLVFPEGLNIVGRYSVNGNILLLPIRGNGPVSLNITAASADVELRFAVETHDDGLEYLAMAGLDVDIDVEGGKIRLSNLFGGDRLLGDMVNTAVNSNFPIILREVKPSVEKALSESFMEIAQQIVSSYPMKDIFPEK